MAYNAFRKQLWKMVPAAVCWTIWLERNNRVFKDHSEPTLQVYRKAKDLILFWARRCKGYDDIPIGDIHRHWERVIGLAEF